MTHKFVLQSGDWRVARQTRLNHVKKALLHRLDAVSILFVPDHALKAGFNIDIILPLGHIGVNSRQFSTKLPGSIFQYVSRVHINFHAQKSARRATVTTNSFPRKALHPLLSDKLAFREKTHPTVSTEMTHGNIDIKL